MRLRSSTAPTDITSAVADQNNTVSVGDLGSQPVVPGQQFTATITAQSQLTSVDDFRNILYLFHKSI